MATADSVKAKIQGLIESANATTGSSDATMTDVINTLISGYGAGGDADTQFREIVDGTITDFTPPNDFTKIRDYLFYNVTSLETVNLKTCSEFERICGYAFYGCSNLQSVVFPDCWIDTGGGYGRISGRAFLNCTSLTEMVTNSQVSFTSAHSSVFEECTSLERVLAPRWVISGGSNLFKNCTNLKIIDFEGTSFGTTCFYGDSSLDTIVIRPNSKGTICTVSNPNVFTGTPFALDGTGGTVYVPESLIESYQTGTNWSSLYEAGTCNFVAIEGSEYE